MSESPAFEPAKHLTSLQGKDYLECKWRLVWLRDVHPDAELVTECLFADDKSARFLCTITVPSGGIATGHGSETAGDFRDFYEKAETKAIGRACAALGFGTQFAPDHEFGADVGRVVDTPVQRSRGPAPQRPAPMNPVVERVARRAVTSLTRTTAKATDTPPSLNDDAAPAMANAGQVAGITRMWKELGRNELGLAKYLFESFAQEAPAALTFEEAGKAIAALSKEVTVEQRAQKALVGAGSKVAGEPGEDQYSA